MYLEMRGDSRKRVEEMEDSFEEVVNGVAIEIVLLFGIQYDYDH